MSQAEHITVQLMAWSDGDQAALESLVPLVYCPLHRMATRQLSQEGVEHTLQPTALINEVYLRLMGHTRVQWRDRAHFYAVCAQIMRCILVDHARRKRRAKRGGDSVKMPLEDIHDGSGRRSEEVLALDDALRSLAEFDPRKSQMVELRYFGGMTVKETAEVLGVSVQTIHRDWNLAKAWLYRELYGSDRSRPVDGSVPLRWGRAVNPDRWRELAAAFQIVLDQPANMRRVVLEQSFGDDAVLRDEVERLLVAWEDSGEFLESSALADLGLTDSPLAAPGDQFSQYKIERLLGAGAVGEVYLARDLQLGRPVALKMLRRVYSADERLLAGFQREAEAASALNHANIITIHAIGEDRGVHFITTEFIDGVTLRDRLGQGALSDHDLLHVAEQVANALSAAHRADVLHGDIKPENLMQRADGLVKVLDFGLARSLSCGRSSFDANQDGSGTTQPVRALRGTLAYLSPEQIRGEGLDQRTDVFSFGVVMYELTTGIRPFRGDDPCSLFRSITLHEPDWAHVAPDLRPVIAKALHKDRHARYPSAAALRDALSRLRGRRQATRNSVLDDAPPPVPAQIHFGTNMRALLAAGVMVILAAAAGALFHDRHGQQHPLDSTDGATTEVSHVSVRSIAILPFRVFDDDQDTAVLSLGITDSLITQLSHVRELAVRSTGAVQTFRANSGESVDPLEAGRMLRAQVVVDGELQRTADRTHVTVRVLRVSDGTPLWSSTFDEPSEDLLKLQETISQELVRVLAVELTSAERRTLTLRHTDNLEAYQAFVNARYAWTHRQSLSVRAAIEHYHRAIAKDPLFALAHAGLADAYAVASIYDFYQVRYALPSAKASALAALELDGQLAEPYTTLAYTRFCYERDWERAEAEFRHSIALNPNHSTSHQWYGEYLMFLGRFEEAEAEFRIAMELDPLSPVIHAMAGFADYFQRDFDQARENFQRTIDRFPTDTGISVWGCAMCDLLQGRYESAHRVLGTMQSPPRSSSWGIMALACVYARQGERATAEEILTTLEHPPNGQTFSPYHLACISASLNDRDRAIGWLEQAIADRDELAVRLNVDPLLDPLRNDRRFQALKRQLQFPGKTKHAMAFNGIEAD